MLPIPTATVALQVYSPASNVLILLNGRVRMFPSLTASTLMLFKFDSVLVTALLDHDITDSTTTPSVTSTTHEILRDDPIDTTPVWRILTLGGERAGEKNTNSKMMLELLESTYTVLQLKMYLQM